MNELLLRRIRHFAAVLLLGLPVLAEAAPSGLEEIEQQLRSKPAEAIVALDDLLDRAGGVERIKARLADAAAVERSAAELEALAGAERQPLAQAAAALLGARAG